MHCTPGHTAAQPVAHCCRIQLEELLASALPVPEALPITKPLPCTHPPSHPPPPLPPPPAHDMPSSAGALTTDLGGSIQRATETAPEHKAPAKSDTAARRQGQGQRASDSSAAPSHVGAFGKSTLKGLKLNLAPGEAADGDRSVGRAKEALAAAVKGVDASDYTTLQAVSTMCLPLNA